MGERIASAEEFGAKGVVFINQEDSGEPIKIERTVPSNIDYAIISEAENEEALSQIRKGEQATLINQNPNGANFEIAANQEVQFYDNVWLSKDLFIWLVIGLLTLVFGWAMIYRKKQLAKDAKKGAVAYFAIVISLLLISYFSGFGKLFFFDAYQLRSAYGFIIGAIFSGVIGVGFYPIFGNRVWCRFGCPMAAILGFQQRLFSKFRITTNGGQCISCGNCSTYCEMGIDVRAYAQKGENIVRSSCVGCGICSAVCPRGVLKLENDSRKGRINSNEILLGNDVDLMDYVNQD